MVVSHAFDAIESTKIRNARTIASATEIFAMCYKTNAGVDARKQHKKKNKKKKKK